MSPGSGTPTGTVLISDGKIPVKTCSITLSAGVGTCTIVETTPGSYTFTGVYSGDGNFTSSSGATVAAVVVSKANSSTVVTNNAVSPVTGTSFTFSVAVSAVSPAMGVPAGTVVWTVTDPKGNPVSCLNTTLSGGTATCTVTNALTGTYSARAAFTDSDSDFTNSSSQVDTVAVTPASTTTTITSITPAVTGQPFTVNVSVAPVAPGAGVPTGNATVSDGTHSCVAALSGVVGNCQLTDNAGSYTISATYSGDPNFLTSTTTQPYSVTPASTTTTITSITPAITGQPFNVKVTIAPVSPGAGVPTGTVTVSDGTHSCVVTLSGATGFCQLTDNAGNYTIKATYGGDPNFLTSNTSQGFTVTKASQVINFTSVAPANAVVDVGQYTVVATGGLSGNPVTFTSATPTVCTVSGSTVSFVGAGTCTINANQAGNANYSAAPEATQSFAVYSAVKCDSSITLTPKDPPSVPPGTSVKFVAQIQVTHGEGVLVGTVDFSVNGVAVTGCQNVKLSSDEASCTIPFPQSGTFTVAAGYSGDPKFPNTSVSTVQVVTKGTTSLKITPSSTVSSGTQVTYNAAVTATSGTGTPTGTVSFTENGLPVVGCQGVGLSAGSVTCPITFQTGGTYTVAATYSGDANFAGSSTSVSQYVSGSPPSITTSSLANAVQGQYYSVELAGTGGSTPYSWSLTSGNLPTGLSLNTSTGLISGTPSGTSKTETFTVKLTDAKGATATKSFTITVTSKPVFTCGNSANGYGGHPFSFQVTVNGNPNPSFGESGKLPQGLSFNPNTGYLSGVPAIGTTGTYNITFSAQNSAGTSNFSFTLRF